MNKRLQQMMAGQEGSYVLPFFWPYEGHPETVEPEIEAIYACGVREICVEARPFEDYAGPGWWEHMDAILAAVKQRGMRVWILDDKRFPTGSHMKSIRFRHASSISRLEYNRFMYPYTNISNRIRGSTADFLPLAEYALYSCV